MDRFIEVEVLVERLIGESDVSRIVNAVRASLSDDLRRRPYRGNANPYAGHCYVASEAIYHLLGGSASGLTPVFVRHEGEPHWFLRGGGQVIDPTAEQFRTPVPYSQGVGKGFLTREPSARAQVVMQRAQERLN